MKTNNNSVIGSYLILSLIFFLTGCPDPEPEPATLEISKNSLDFSIYGDEKSFSVESNISWTVSNSEPSWLTVSPSSGSLNGTVTVKVDPNTSTVTSTPQRTATITISGGNIVRTITLKQDGFDASLSVSETSINFSDAAGKHTCSITSNINWKVSQSTASWLSVSPTSGSKDSTITVTATANTSTEQRTATITISGGDITHTLNVIQSGAALSISTTSLYFSDQPEHKTFTIKSDTSWVVSKDVSWLTVSPTSGSKEGTVTVTSDENTSTSRREATITVSGGNITRTIKVSQSGFVVSLSVSNASLSFSSAPEKRSFTITSNTSWEVSSNAQSWLTVSPSSGSLNGTVTVTVTDNTDTSERTATITVNAMGTMKTISVKQAGASLILELSVNSVEFSGETVLFFITSNTMWVVFSDASSWLSFTDPYPPFTSRPSLSGSGNDVVRFSAFRTAKDRSATITVRCINDVSITRTIHVTQYGSDEPLVISTTQMSYGSSTDKGQSATPYFTITSNSDWTVSSNASWLTVSPTSGSKNGQVTVTIAPNTTTSARSGMITVSGSSKSRNIRVNQSAALPVGNITFYATYNFGQNIQVTLNGQGTKSITGYVVQGSVICGGQYTASFENLPNGTYSYTATCGSRRWSGTIARTLECISIRLDP